MHPQKIMNQAVENYRDFVVPFVGLSVGNHRFEFKVDDAFFDHFEYSSVHKADVDVVAELDKKERMLVFSFELKGIIETICDRCGDVFQLNIENNENLIVKFGEQFEEESEEMITIPESEYKIDLAPFIYEYILLSIPLKAVHPDDENGESTCNKDALALLSKLQDHTETDSRWDALSKLKNDLE